MEEKLQQEIQDPAPQAVAPSQSEVVQPKEPDLITRVSQVKTEVQAKQELDEKFNINELDSAIEKLPDPKLKEQVLGLKKSLIKGENQKYQEIANLRKQYEQELAQRSQWTPERVNGLLQDPNFVNAARSIVERDTSTSTSMLSEQEKTMLEQNNRQVQALLQQNQQLLRVQQDAQIKTKYANYDPEVVDKTYEDMVTGRVQATREHIWKVVDYENAVKRAYELGRTDKGTLNQERVGAMTYDSGRNVAQPISVEKQKNESTSSFMKRAYAQHSKNK